MSLFILLLAKFEMHTWRCLGQNEAEISLILAHQVEEVSQMVVLLL